MDRTPFDRLSPRHRQCLTGVLNLRSSKEIASDLGIAQGTVDSYITEAVKLLGARDRRQAARMLAEHDRATPLAPTPGENAAEHDAPENNGAQSPGVSETTPDAASMVASEGPLAPAGPPPLRAAGPGGWWPLRRKGQADNNLGIVQRLIWIPVIAIALAIGFGMLMSGLQALAALIWSTSALFH